MPREKRGMLGAGVVVIALVLLALRAAGSQRVPTLAPIVVTRSFVEYADTVRPNGTLSDLFARQGIGGSELLDVLQALDGLEPRRVRAGAIFEFATPVGGTTPTRVRHRLGNEAFVMAERGADGWQGIREEIGWVISSARISGTVQSSLYETIDELVPDTLLDAANRGKLVDELADGIYGWVIDFTRDIHPGDPFTVVFEYLTSSAGDRRYGRVLAASVFTARVEHTAYVLSDAEGRNAYYDADGNSLRRAFKMYPVKFRRISSGFSRARLHPVLKTSRPHLGTDYAADIGTPIEATADGTIVRAGRWGSYGIMVAIRHARDIETRYAHMSRLAPGIRPGVRVGQGEVIGFVGMTGLVSGPHVHYEFLKNGRQLNPRSVDLGDGEPVPSVRRAEFDSVRDEFDRLLGRATGGLARSD